MTVIREMREAAGISQTELARRTGIAQPHLSAYENGRRTVTDDVLARVRAATRRRPSELLAQHREQIVKIVRDNRGREVKVFGSVARGDDTVDSDIDLLVEFDESAALLHHSRMIADLEVLTGARVDVVDAGGLHGQSGERIARTAVPI